MTKKDIRVLCSQHAKEVIYAKFALIRTNNQIKSECDKCSRMAWEYEIKKVEDRFKGRDRIIKRAGKV